MKRQAVIPIRANEDMPYGTVVALLRDLGDPVTPDLPWLAVEEEGIVIEIALPHCGRLKEWLVAAGDEISPGMAVARIAGDSQGVERERAAILRALYQDEAVAEAAVLARQAPGGDELAAYVVVHDRVSPQVIGDRLVARLTDHRAPPRIPDAIVGVTRIPYTGTGEVDEQVLQSVPVLDSATTHRWQHVISAVDGVGEVAVLAVPATIEPAERLHLAHLLPGTGRSDELDNQQPSAPPAHGKTARQPVSHPHDPGPAVSDGGPLPNQPLPATLTDLLQRAVRRAPQQAIVYASPDGSERVQTYAELATAAGHLAAALRGHGLAPGDTILLQLDERRDFVTGIWACFLAGLVPLPGAIASSYEDRNHAVAKLHSSWQALDCPPVLASAALVPRVRNLARLFDSDPLRVLAIDELMATVSSNPLPAHRADPDDSTLFLMTSGSTGTPKLVEHTHRTLLSRELGTVHALGFTGDDISLCWLPLDHVASLVDFHLRDVFLACRQIQVATPAVLADPLYWLDLIDKHRASITWAPNFAYGLVVDRAAELASRTWDLTCLRHAFNGGEAISPRTAMRFLDLLEPFGLPANAMRPVWGMSETASGVTYSFDYLRGISSSEPSFMNLGPPVPGFAARVVDEQGQVVSESTIGRLHIKGCGVFPGYYRAPELNREVFTEDGWFKTGDLAMLRDGNLFITGREKDVIIIRGANYYSHEIESAVEEVAGVQPSYTAACAVRSPGAATDKLAIFFHPAVDDMQSKLALIDRIRDEIMSQIGLYPDHVLPLAKAAIPKTGIGKIQRSRLKKQFEHGQFDRLLEQLDLAEGNENTLPNWFFERVWQPRAVHASAAGPPPRRVLVFVDRDGLGETLVRALRAAGVDVHCVRQGSGFQRQENGDYRLDPADLQGYQALWNDLARRGESIRGSELIDGVIHLWSYGQASSTGDSSDRDSHAALQLGAISVLELLRAAAQILPEQSGQPLFLWVASSLAQTVAGNEPVVPERSMLAPMVRTGNREITRLRARLIDLPLASPAQNTVRLLTELRVVDREPEVAWREQRRLVPRLRRADLGSSGQDLDSLLRNNGVYLITGGLGGIGTELAHHLLRRYRARLLLIGRRPLATDTGERGDPASPTPDDPRARTLAELRQLDGDVIYQAADVCEPEQIAAAVQRGEALLGGPVEGVFHLAGATRECPLHLETPRGLMELVRPKLTGSRILHGLAGDRAGFFIGFSSVTSLFGGASAGAYAAASRALASVCHQLRDNRPARVHCFGFSMWDELGMSAGFAQKELARAAGYELLSPRQGVDSLMAGLAAAAPSLIVGLNASNPRIAGLVIDDRPAPDLRLCAFYAPAPDRQAGDPGRADLASPARADVTDRYGNRTTCELQPIAEIPRTAAGDVDRDQLAQWARQLAGRADRASGAESATDIRPRNHEERQLAALFGAVLGVRGVAITDNFFQLGGQSIRAIQLLNRIRETMDVVVEPAQFLDNPTVAQLSDLIARARSKSDADGDPSGRPDPADPGRQFLPAIEPDAEHRFHPFPLTEIQQAYWIGRSADFELGDVAMHLYAEVDTDALDVARLERAWNQVIARHDMLRAVIRADGSESVLPQAPDYSIAQIDLRGHSAEARGAALAELRHTLSHQILPADRWPGFDIRVAHVDRNRARLFISMAAVHLDGSSFLLTMAEWGRRYRDPDFDPPPLTLCYRDYALALRSMRTSQVYRDSLAYWTERLPDLPPSPALPLARELATLETYRFVHRWFRVERQTWEKIKALANKKGVSRSVVGLTAYASVLSAWSRGRSQTLNVTVFNRLPLHPEVDHITGDFTSMILLAVDQHDEDDFESLARRIQEQLWRDMANRYVSGVEVLRELARVRRQASRALMPVVFTSALDLDIAGTTSPYSALQDLGAVTHQASQTPQVCLDCQLFEEAGALLCMWDSVDQAFPNGMVDDMLASYQALMLDLADEANWQQRPQLVPEAQLARRRAVNQTSVPSSENPAHQLLHTGLARQAARQPEHPAIIARDRTLDYGQLHSYGNQIGRWLRDRGAAPDRLVAVVMHRGWQQISGALGVLVSGAAYLPIDPSLPATRRNLLMADGQVSLAVTTTALAAELDWPDSVQVVTVDGPEVAAQPDDPLDSVQGPGDLAYVIYTSGSTGKPKGVSIEHRSAINTIIDINRRFDVSPADRIFALSSLSFDLSVYDLFGALTAGATVVVPRPGSNRDPDHWLECLRRDQVTVWNSVPTLMDMLVTFLAGRSQSQGNDNDNDNDDSNGHVDDSGSDPGESLIPSLRLVMMSGDWIPLDLPDRIRRHAPAAQIISMGGATEASIWSIIYPIAEIDPCWASIPYGKPMRNQRFHVLDERLDPCPVWVAGDLYIGGLGLARGYWRDPDRTRASFFVHPRTGERLYRTGDLGRYLPDGSIEFLGREDHQVKIQGHRIELGEINAVLLEHPRVTSAVVVAAGEGRQGRYLVGHVVLTDGAELATDELERFAGDSLPGYMVPASIVYHERLPLTATGKIDRAVLSRITGAQRSGFGADTGGADQAPATPLQTELVELWRGLLQVETLGVHDELLQLGLNSLIAINAVNAIRQRFGVDIGLRSVFAARASVASLALLIADQAANVPASPADARRLLPTITPQPPDQYDSFPLSAIQEAYWVGRMEAFELGNVAAYFYLEVDLGDLDAARLERAWQRVIDRHGMLRAVFQADGRQRILPPPTPYSIEVLDLHDCPDKPAERELAAIRDRMSQQVLPPDRWPLFEFRVTRLPDRRYRLHFGLDLLIADAWSVQILFGDLQRFYRDPDRDLDPLSLSFRDYVLAEKQLIESALYQRSQAYWLERLDSLPPAPQLPLVKQIGDVAHPVFKRYHAALAADRWQTLTGQARQRGLTPSGLLLAAFAEILGRWSRSRRFCLDVTTFNRLPLHDQTEHVVGDFTSINLLAVDGRAPTFEARAGQIQKRLLEDLEHRYFGGLSVLRELAQRRGGAPAALVPIVFTSLLDSYGRSGDFVPLGGKVVFATSQTPQVWLDHQVREQDGELLLTWDVVAELLPDGLPDTLFAAYCGLLHSLAEDPAVWHAAELDLLPAGDRAVRERSNDTAIDIEPTAGRPALLHTLFGNRAQLHPDHPAVITPELTLSYAQLQARANGIARWLRGHGARPNTLVAVVMPKGWTQVAGVVGILTAGAAYLPIDPALPARRRNYLLDNGQVDLVLTDAQLADTLDWPDTVRVLDVTGREAASQDTGPIAPIQTERDIAYVIFTSGSTGQPKGVVIEHRSAVNTIVDVNRRFRVRRGDRVFALSSLSFDLSVYDVFGTLAAGATIVYPQAGSERDPDHWLDVLKQQRVTVWNSVPALADMLGIHAESHDTLLPDSLRLVLMSGDWIPVALPDRIRARGHEIAVISLGGATEASIWSILHPIERVDPAWTSIPYGTPMANQRFHVLDEHLAPCPVWVAGELYIGGIGLAREYWRNPDETAARFTVHPRRGERLYRTGDMGRYRPDGTIEFLGRDDFQVKIHGHRIELGEIEAALLQHRDVESAVVDAAGQPPRPRRLVAYVVFKADREPNSAAGREQLRAHLAELLPDYMVPNAFAILAALPLTANGKVDRKALSASPAADLEASILASSDDRATPRSPLEHQLAALWTQLLSVPVDDRSRGFFELGGNSMTAIQMLGRLRQTSRVDVSLRDFFATPTVAGLASLVARARVRDQDEQAPDSAAVAELPELVHAPGDRFKPFALSAIQQAYWMGRNRALELGNVAAHFYFELDLRTHHPERIEMAWRRLIAHHDMLRTVIRPDGTQQVLEHVPDFEIAIVDLRGRDATAALQQTRDRLSHQVVPADRWPLFEICISRLEDQLIRVHFSFDLLIADAWSARLLFSDFARLFHDPTAQLDAGDITFRDYICAVQRLPETAAYQRSAAYWNARLPHLPPAPALPLARDPTTIDAPRFERRSARLAPAAWRALCARAARAGITPSGLLLSAYADVLAMWSANPTFTINVTTFNRLPIHPHLRDLVGDFTSLTLLAVDSRAGDRFETRARAIQEQLWQDLDHRFISGVQVVRDLARQRGLAPGALIPVVFTSRLFASHRDGPDLPTNDDGSPAEVVYSVSQTPQVWLDKQVFERDGGLAWTWDSVAGLFPSGMMDDMFTAYSRLVQRLADSEAEWTSPVCNLLPPAHAELARSVNATDVPVSHALLHELVLAQAERGPDRLAVITAETRLTYAELVSRARAVARWLTSHGAEPEELVAIVMEKGWEQPVAALAVLLCGAAYLPIDPSWPEQRRNTVLQRGRVKLALTQSHCDQPIRWPDAVRRLCVDAPVDGVDFGDAGHDSMHVNAEHARVAPDNLAYVIFTSGSTGDPKGVAIEHRGAVNTIFDINRRFAVGPGDRVLAVSNLTFDLSVYDIFGILAAGGALVIPATTLRPDPASWLDLMLHHQVSVWNSVPALMQIVVAFAGEHNLAWPESLRLILLSGDWVPLDIADRIRRHRRDCDVISLGGATEGSIWSIVYPIERVDPSWVSIPYGKPLANQQMFVLDGQFRQCPHWVPGEIYIGGIGVAREYYDDDKLTAQSFPIHPETGQRLYRTGDLGRLLPDGTIEFLGRSDEQVKVHGHRIELGEIEAALGRHPAVKEAVVTAPWLHGKAGPGGSRRLVALIVEAVDTAGTDRDDASDRGDDPAVESPISDELRRHVRSILPEYMVPGLFLALPRLPLTSNGKVDRAALDELASTGTRALASQVRAGVEPRSPREARIARLWRDALGVDHVGVRDNFFDLGGNSLMALEILARLRQAFHVELTLQTLFEHVTIAELADAISQLEASSPADPADAHEQLWPTLTPDPSTRHDPFPLTAVQQAYWIGRMEGIAGGNIAAHAYYELDSNGLDIAAFERAFQRMIQRHDALRIVVGGNGFQRILPDVPPYRVEITDLRPLDETERDAALDALRQRMSHQVLDTETWPIFEVRATRIDDRRTRLHLSFDLLISDAWSSRILFHELAMCLRGQETGSEPVFEPIDISFRDYVLGEIVLRDSAPYQRSRRYWQSRLDQLPPAPELPVLHRSGTARSPRFIRYRGDLAVSVWQRLQERGARASLTPSGLLLAAFCEILTRWSRHPRFTVNITTFNRLPLHPQVDQLMGDFTSLTLLAVDNSGRDSFTSRARRIQEQLWADLDHRYTNGVDVLRELARRSGGDLAPRAPVVFTSRLLHGNRFAAGDESSQIFGDVVYSVSQTPQVWLDHQVVEEAGVLRWTWDVIDGLFPAGMIEAMFDSYSDVLQRLADSDEAWTESAIHLLSAAWPNVPATKGQEVLQVLPPGQELLHTGFERQAADCPERSAVIAHDRTLSYGELARAAYRLAHWLRDNGAAPDTLVAVVVDKGWEQIAAVLAVLHSGAAYLPIDPQLPPSRVQHLLERGEVSLILTHSRHVASLSQLVGQAGAMRMLPVDRAALDTDWPDSALPTVQRPFHLAYVIFTSGSTGSPKGVAIEHRAAVNTVRDVNARFSVRSDDRVLALSSLSFDLSVYDIFGPLARGGAVVLPHPDRLRDPGHWAELMNQHRVTMWNSVPALMEMMMDSAEHATVAHHRLPPGLRLVLLSGDWIPLPLPDRIRAQRESAQIISMGGATEAAIWSILYPIGAVDPDWPSIPYGQAMRGQRFYVLDRELQPCPNWVCGELYIAGDGLAREYWRDPARTRDAFFDHPDTGERLYRTGDHGRMLPDRTIEFMGRDDLQVKILGHRVELGEIEAALADCPEVASAVIDASFVDASNQITGRHRRLVAYVVPSRRPGHGHGEVNSSNAQPRATIELPALLPGEPTSAQATAPVGIVTLSALGRLLACLRQIQPDNLPVAKYRYPSGGGLYPVQVYVSIAPEGVVGATEGFYIYHPRDHQLLRVADRVDMPAATQNAPFTLHLVARMSAIGPLYPELAGNFCLLEAGYMVRLLTGQAPSIGIAMVRSRAVNVTALCAALDLQPADQWLVAVHGAASPAELPAARPAPRPPWPETLQSSQPVDWRGQAITDPIERLTFKLRQHGLPTPRQVFGHIDLAGGEVDRDTIRVYQARRSARDFLPEAIELNRFGAWLGCLSGLSAGLPVMRSLSTPGADSALIEYYVHVKSGRIASVAGGAYRYDPGSHSLVLLGPDADIDRAAHGPTNRPIYDRAAFTLLFVVAGPVTDEHLIAAGEIGQVLMEKAGLHSIGVCPLGGIDMAEIRQVFGLSTSHALVHLFVGGRVPDQPLSLHDALQEEQRVAEQIAASQTRPESPPQPPAQLAPLLAGDHDLTRQSLAAYLGERLPQYMVPAIWVFLDRLPLTKNDKIDRKALAALAVDDAGNRARPEQNRTPQNQLEQIIHDAVAQILGLGQIGTLTNFFELGANSLQLVQLHRELEAALGKSLAITQIFANPSVTALAKTVAVQSEDALEAGRQRARQRLTKGRRRRRKERKP
ncbi:MAG: amino acid adenylation domain-containing protein [Proteobacteria bacterium]|nr:amino acid adenylation domain-containing protein [Pseudomonadota bacterium]